VNLPEHEEKKRHTGWGELRVQVSIWIWDSS